MTFKEIAFEPTRIFAVNAKIFVGSFIAIVAGYVIARYALEIARGGHYWATGDWLIHYGAGFVRRGLSGTVTVAISDFTGIAAHLVAGAMQIGLYAAMVALVLIVFAQVQWTGPVLMLLVSPVFLLMPFYYLKLAMVKEMVGFLAVAMIASYLPLRSRALFWGGVGLFAIAGFVHEVNTFLLPAALVLIALFDTRDLLTRHAARIAALIVAAGALTAALLAYTFNGNGMSQEICAQILARGLSERFCIPESPVMWLEHTTSDAMGYMWASQIESGIWPLFILGYLAAIAPFFLFRATDDPDGRRTRRALAVAALGIVIYAPLFVIASDWGRWIAVYIFGLTLVTITALKLGLIAPRIRSGSILFVLYGLVWSMPDFGGAEFSFGLLDKLGRLVMHLGALV